MLPRLKEATADLHAQTEALLYSERILRSQLTVEEYAHLLLTHYTFHRALELALSQEPERWGPIDPVGRRKAHLAAAELQALSLRPPVAKLHFADWSFEELLGACYVGEGSTLGGAVIARCLMKNPELAERIAPLQFFGAYGADTGPRWKAFGEFLNAQPASVEAGAIEGAQRAFQLFMNLFKQNQTYMSTAFESADGIGAASPTRKKIIVFDDNADLLDLVGRVLGKLYDVEVCVTLDRVQETVSAFTPDLILLDNSVGARDGREAVEALQADPSTRQIPVILISGNANIEALARDLRVAGHLAKPFSIRYLREYVSEMLT